MEQYVGEVRQFGGSFVPAGWLLCDGKHVNITQYQDLFNLIGITYGGNGTTTFAVPDLRGRVPICQGTAKGGAAYFLGDSGGTETETLNVNQIPLHTHVPNASSTGGSDSPGGYIWGAATAKAYGASPGNATLNGNTVQPTGNNQPHDNMIPFLAVTYIIATNGTFPEQ